MQIYAQQVDKGQRTLAEEEDTAVLNTRRYTCFAVFVCLFALARSGLAVSVNLEELVTDMPCDGYSTIYYDIDAHGHLLEIDYPARKARMLGTIPSDVFDPVGFRGTVYRPEEHYLFFYAGGPGGGHSPWCTLCGLDLKTADASSILQYNANADGWLLPLSRHAVYATVGEQGPCVIDSTSHTEKKTEAGIPADKYAFDGATMQLFLFCGPGLRTPLITMLDLRTGCVADRLNVSEVIGVSGEDADIAVYALSGNLALGEFRYKAEQTYHLFLINVSAHRLLATSDGLRITVQRDYVERISDEAALVSCVEKNPRTSQTESVGTVRCRRVDLKSAYFSTLETLKYDPGKQLALQVKGHGFAIFPRYRFDYVSSRLLDVRGPDNFREPPPSAEELEKRIARIQSDLTAQVGKEADIPVYHLDIKDEKGK